MTEVRVPPRSEIPLEHQWDSFSIFPDHSAWEAEIEAFLGELAGLADWQGQLGSSPQKLLAGLKLVESFQLRAIKIYMHAGLVYYPDTQNPEGLVMIGKAQGVYGQTAGAVAFLNPEILSIGESTLQTWLAENPDLAIYSQAISDLFRQQAHVRNAEVEQILGMVQDPFSTVESTYNVLTDSELKFADALDSTGKSHPVAQSSIETLKNHPDRDLRRNAWNNYADGYLAFQNTLANNWVASIKQGVFLARTRGYDSTLAANLFGPNIPLQVYENLLQTFQANLGTWHKYWRIRRQALKLESLHPYDIWAPLTDKKFHIPYEQAVDWICEGLQPLGAEYVETARRGLLEERWVDRYPNEGKTAGAFSAGSYGTKPFILMSYDGGLFELSTLAHELGHSMHSYLTWTNQPLVYGDYSIFAAEVASNFNQALVREHLFKVNEDPLFQIQVIEEAMYNFHRYFFIMPTLARFERQIHQMVEAGEGVSAEQMNEVMFGFFKEGYGEEMTLDEKRIGITWAQFPHLYSHFYVYQYATGISAANALAKQVLHSADSAQAYLGFLKAGSSDYPMEVLKRAGADLSTPQIVETAFGVLAGYVDRLEALVEAL